MKTFLAIFLLALAIGLLLFIEIRDRYTCWGDCERGDRRCQEMCLSRNFCAFGESE